MIFVSGIKLTILLKSPDHEELAKSVQELIETNSELGNLTILSTQVAEDLAALDNENSAFKGQKLH